MTNNSVFSEYDDLMDDLSKDHRLGDHDWMVSEVIEDTWESGDPRIKVQGVLLTAGQVRCDLSWSPPPSPAPTKAEIAAWTNGRRLGVRKAIEIGKKLAEYYGKAVRDLKAGDVVRVKTGKTKVNAKTGKGGFIEVQVILPKEQIGQASKDAAVAASGIPF